MATLNEVSPHGGVQIVTIPNPAADIAATSQACRSCQIQHQSGTATYMNVNGAATTASYVLPKAGTLPPLVYEIENLKHLHFIGTAGDKVQILWRG